LSILPIETPRWCLPLLNGDRGKPRYRGAKGGRASGKSHFFGEAVIERLIEEPNTKIICIREVQKSLEFSSLQLLKDKINKMGVGHYFEIQKNRIMTVKGKGIVIFQGMQDHTAESVKSLEGFDVAWVEEAQSMSNRSLELLDPTIRKEGSELWFSWNPNLDTDPVVQIFKNNDNAVLVHVNYLDNPFVTDATKEMAERTRANNVLKYNHIWLGDYMKEIEGALWNGDMLQASRVNKDEIPDLTRIVVAIDPSVTGNAKSDETGIVVAGRTANDNTYYVLEDCSLRGTPDQWIRRAVVKYHEYQADRIIAEVNNGGDLVENLLRNTDKNVSYRSVRATRGKMLRAEPIAALYENKKVFHAGKFSELEEQMIFYNGRGNVSPDRLDALVWAITDLSQSTGQPMWRIS
jgi:phage terminase large subunit-like protein